MKLLNSNDKIFIAGHNGMVGKAICRALRKNLYLNLITINKSELDLQDSLAVKKWFVQHKPDVVIIAAAKVGGIYANQNYPVDFLLNNLEIQNNLIKNSFENNVRRLLFLGSSCIYPKFAEQPIKEDYLLQSPLENSNESYAIAKIAGIKLCEAYRKQYGFDAISVMPTNLYGPGDNYHPLNSHVLPAMIRKLHLAKKNNLKFVECWGSGSPLREFLHANDLGEACIFLLENWDPSDKEAPLDSEGQPLLLLNVGTGKDISIKDLAILISKIVNFNGEIKWDLTKPDGTPKKQLDISKIRSLGWEPKISLKEGIILTYEEFKKEFKN